MFFGYFRVCGFKMMTHYDAAIFTARRLEMCEIVEMTLFYFLDRPMVHSPLSGLPFMVSVLTLIIFVRVSVAFNFVSIDLFRVKRYVHRRWFSLGIARDQFYFVFASCFIYPIYWSLIFFYLLLFHFL